MTQLVSEARESSHSSTIQPPRASRRTEPTDALAFHRKLPGICAHAIGRRATRRRKAGRRTGLGEGRVQPPGLACLQNPGRILGDVSRA